ncbi:MAG: helicase [Opitutaceae bacterium]|nr:helicase [Cephaloticoccus sp.]MCP5530108.1 helicase [Opitutaceae bacterium]
MEFELDQRRVVMSVGEFSRFTLGPHDPGEGMQGIWRAQLGTQWHQELRTRVAAENAAASFEAVIEGEFVHQGWRISLTGRIDQIIPDATALVLREIKTVMRPLPVAEEELRAAHPDYFAQAAAYLRLKRLAQPDQPLRAELMFIEAGSGLAQNVALTPADEATFLAQASRIVEFLNLRLRARERLRHLSFRPAFPTPRPGQETTLADLTTAFERQPAVLFEAPTGFGKTGVLLEFALGQLQRGHFDRALYLTSKSTGQIQVMRQLTAMTARTQSNPIGDFESSLAHLSEGKPRDHQSQSNLIGYFSENGEWQETSVAAWHVRNKGEHCINHTFHCVSESCTYLADVEARWPRSGLARFYLLDNHARDLETLRAAGREARICPYEITRAALTFNDVWIGDYNYVFSPGSRSLFYNQPGFNPARTLLIIDEAHNLPSRVADAWSHVASAGTARALLAELDHVNAPANLIRAWESYALLLSALLPVDRLDFTLESDLLDTLTKIASLLATQPLDYAGLGPDFSAELWRVGELAAWLENTQLKKLLWCPREGELAFTCFDASAAIGETLRSFGGVVLASATLTPTAEYLETIGMADFGLAKPDTGDTRDAATKPQSDLSGLRFPQSQMVTLSAATPWREGAYDIAVDCRVDTTFQHRSRHFPTTAATIAALHEASTGAIAVFFPSYAYAEAVRKQLENDGHPLRISLQPRLPDLAAQTAWVEESIAFTDALFLVLGSSFAESIDLLGGRLSHAMVVAPALPEVNAVQRARQAELEPLGREHAFRRVYQIPGLQKVNQALGRLVRAPGQRAKVLLHCKRFAEARYANLLARDYQFGRNIATDAELADWLRS